MIILAFASIGANAQSPDTFVDDNRNVIANEAKDTLYADTSMYGLYIELWENPQNSDVAKPTIICVSPSQLYAIKKRYHYAN